MLIMWSAATYKKIWVCIRTNISFMRKQRKGKVMGNITEKEYKVMTQKGDIFSLTSPLEIVLDGNNILFEDKETKERGLLGAYSTGRKAMEILSELNNSIALNPPGPGVVFWMPSEIIYMEYEGNRGHGEGTYPLWRWREDYLGLCNTRPMGDDEVLNISIDGKDIFPVIQKVVQKRTGMDIIRSWDVAAYLKWES